MLSFRLLDRKKYNRQVKYILQRYLIGLRWWSASDLTEEDIEGGNFAELKIEDNNDWYFESFDFNKKSSMIDSSIFWWGQSASTIFWAIFVVIKVIGLSLFWVRNFFIKRECWFLFLALCLL